VLERERERERREESDESLSFQTFLFSIFDSSDIRKAMVIIISCIFQCSSLAEGKGAKDKEVGNEERNLRKRKKTHYSLCFF